MAHSMRPELRIVDCGSRIASPKSEIRNPQFSTAFRRRAGPLSAPRLRLEVLTMPLAAVLFISAWQCMVWITGYSSYILPSPADVVHAGQKAVADGTLWRHTAVTLF